MAVATIVFIGIYFYIFLRPCSMHERFTKLLVLELLLDLWHLQGSFLGVGTHIIGYRYVNEIIVFFYAMYYQYQLKKIDKRMLVAVIVLFFIIFVSLVRELVIPYDNPIINAWNKDVNWDYYSAGIVVKERLEVYVVPTMMLIFQLMAFVVIVVIGKRVYKSEHLYNILDKIITYSYYLVVYGYFEFFIKNVLGNEDITFIFTYVLLGDSDAAYTSLTVRGAFAGLQGFTREPSHYATFLGELVLLYFMRWKISDEKPLRDIWKVFSILLLMSVSGSFIAFWYLLMTMILYIYFFVKFSEIKRKTMINCLLLIVGGVGIFQYVDSDGFISQRINAAIQVIEYASDGQLDFLMKTGDSSLPRMLSIHDAFDDFMQNMWLGIGLGIESVHSPTVAMLLSYGIMGMLVLFYLLFRTRGENLSYDYKFVFYFFFVYQLFSGRALGLEVVTWFIIEITSLYYFKERKA